MQNNNWSSPFIRSISSFLSLIVQVDGPRIKLDYVCRILKEIANNYLVETREQINTALSFYGKCFISIIIQKLKLVETMMGPSLRINNVWAEVWIVGDTNRTKFELGKWIENRRDGIKSRYNCKGKIDFFWEISCIRVCECKSLHTKIKSKLKQTRANSEETERKLKRKINRMANVRIIMQT